MNWFAVHLNAQKEELASRELQRVGFEVFWPHTTHWVGTGHKDKSRLVKRSWLSRYLFVRTFKENLWAVNGSVGVSTVVKAPGGEPYPIPELVMDAIIAQTDEHGEVYVRETTRRESKFRPGQVIRLLDEKSPLFGLYVEVIKTLDNGNIMCTLDQSLAGTQKTILQSPVIGEVVKGAA